MGDLWQDEGFDSAGATSDGNGDDDWDDGEESLDLSLEDGFDDPVEVEDDDGFGDGED